MRFATSLFILLGAGLLTAQQQHWTPTIRSITMKVISTSVPGLAPIKFEAISAAWRSNHVNLDVEKRLDLALIDKAKEVVLQLHAINGSTVRVEHVLNHIPPRSVEVAFQVVELCAHPK